MLSRWTLIRIIALVTALMVIALPLACSKSDRGFDGRDESLDNTPPSNIADLTVIGMTPTKVSLRWTATGDDNDSGTATVYDLRYLRRELTPINWDSATPVQGMPLPGPSSEADSVVVTGLPQDSLCYFAVRAADEVGNWSGLSNVVRGMCFDNYEVTIADTAFERVIRFVIGKPEDTILRSDLIDIERINAGNQHIHDLSGIEHCISLQSLQLWNNSVTELTPLSEMHTLRVLKIGYNGLTDIGPLASLVDLDTLQLNANSISDITALAGLVNLEELILTSNAIMNTAPLAGKTTIKSLALDGNQVVFVSPLYNLTGLEKLRLSNNLIDDVLGLAANSGLAEGDSLWLTGNPLSASSTDSLLSVLRDRGVIVIL